MIKDLLKIQDESVELLTNQLKEAYCYNCSHSDFDDEGNMSDVCEDCHRKYMMWSLSHESAKKIVQEIMKIVLKYNKE